MKACVHPWPLYFVKIRISLSERGKEKKIIGCGCIIVQAMQELKANNQVRRALEISVFGAELRLQAPPPRCHLTAPPAQVCTFEAWRGWGTEELMGLCGWRPNLSPPHWGRQRFTKALIFNQGFTITSLWIYFPLPSTPNSSCCLVHFSWVCFVVFGLFCCYCCLQPLESSPSSG